MQPRPVHNFDGVGAAQRYPENMSLTKHQAPSGPAARYSRDINLHHMAVEWSNHCESIVGGWRANQERERQRWITPPLSRSEALRTSVKLDDVKDGQMDLAELRHDGSRSFYSNFTPPGLGVPAFIVRLGLGPACAFLSFTCCAIKSLILRSDTLVVMTLGVLSTSLCSQAMFDVRPAFETGPIFFGLIFPIVFLIIQNWKRREQAVDRVGALRANFIHLALKILTGNGDKDKASWPRALDAVDVAHALFEEIGDFLPQDTNLSGPRLAKIYGLFADLQNMPECQLVTRFALCEFEKLRMQRDYRTPWGLNYFCFLFGFFAPALLGPHFARIGCPPKSLQEIENTCGLGSSGAFFSCVFFAILVSALLAVVKDLEDPFDFAGFDDVLVQFRLERNALHKAFAEFGTKHSMPATHKADLEDKAARKESKEREHLELLRLEAVKGSSACNPVKPLEERVKTELDDNDDDDDDDDGGDL